MTLVLGVPLDKCLGAAGCDSCPSRRNCLPASRPVGRPPGKGSVQNVLNAVYATATVSAAAERLGVSRAAVYRVLKAAGLTPREVQGRA